MLLKAYQLLLLDAHPSWIGWSAILTGNIYNIDNLIETKQHIFISEKKIVIDITFYAYNLHLTLGLTCLFIGMKKPVCLSVVCLCVYACMYVLAITFEAVDI